MIKRRKPLTRKTPLRRSLPTSNKYGVAQPRDRTYNGRMYRSKLEAIYAQSLDLMLKAGDILSWEYEPRFKLEVEGVKIANHFPDFLVTTQHGQEEIHECKGVETDAWRMKWRLMKALFPEYRYKVIKWGDIR